MRANISYMLKNWIAWDKKSPVYFLIRVVVLDEPTAALDPIAENEIYSRSRRKRKNEGKSKKTDIRVDVCFFLQNAAAVLLTSVQKCDSIYTERFCIVKTAGARTKQLQIAK